jgi:hypothetical protein
MGSELSLYPNLSRTFHWVAPMINADAPTNAALHSPDRRLFTAILTAYVLLAHAASSEMLAGGERGVSFTSLGAF